MLLQHGHVERAVVLAVLSLEEVGKLIYINELAFSLLDDVRRRAFHDARRQHHRKLTALDSYPVLIVQFARLDQKIDIDKGYNKQVQEIIKGFHRLRADLAPWLGEENNILELDSWKQKGLYVDFDKKRGFIAPGNIQRDFASAVVAFAVHVSAGLDLVLTDNLDRYQGTVHLIRRTVPASHFNRIRDVISEALQGQ